MWCSMVAGFRIFGTDCFIHVQSSADQLAVKVMLFRISNK